MSADELRAEWHRRIRLECGCTLPCRCDWRDHPTERRVEAYIEALSHLQRHGLTGAALRPELRVLCARGGADQRLAEAVLDRWAA